MSAHRAIKDREDIIQIVRECRHCEHFGFKITGTSELINVVPVCAICKCRQIEDTSHIPEWCPLPLLGTVTTADK